MIDLARHRIRSRIEAALLASGDRRDTRVSRFKRAAIGDLDGRIVEIGAGTGVNLRLYRPGVRVTAIEPNPVMRDRLAHTNEALDTPVDLDIRDGWGEELTVGDAEADAVVSTLVPCGVDRPDAVVDEVRRVLRPGGSFVFTEHVAAPPTSMTAAVQGLVRRPHRWMFNGCRVDQDTESILRRPDWADLDLQRVDLGPAGAYVRHQIMGVAIR